jgi:flagellar motor protein MotB
MQEVEQVQAPKQVVEEMAMTPLEKEVHSTQVANLDENIETLQSEPSQASQVRAAPRTVTPKPNPDIENSEEIVIALNGFFASGQNITSNKSQDIIKQKAEQIKAMPNYRISVEGHTDSIPVGNTGSNLRYTDNMSLSYWRAMSVAMQLIELGVDSRRITVKGYGKTRPVASNETPEGRAKNRRVEIRMIRD